MLEDRLDATSVSGELELVHWLSRANYIFRNFQELVVEWPIQHQVVLTCN